MNRIKIFVSAILFVLNASAQSEVWEGDEWCGHINASGCLDDIIFKSKLGNDTITFFKGEGNRGPSFYTEKEGKSFVAKWMPSGHNSYCSVLDNVECRIKYTEWNNQPALKITLSNNGYVPFEPTKSGIKLGIDTYMDKYPDWFGKYFPTLLKNEKSHFYGYLQTPKGNTLGIVSPNAIASWSVNYNLGYQDPAPNWFMGHRIESLNIDLINVLPLPQHNPQNLWKLNQGESKTWIIAFIDIRRIEDFEDKMHCIAQIPMLKMEQTTYSQGEEAKFEVLASKKCHVEVHNDQGALLPLKVEYNNRVIKVSCKLPEVGLYNIIVKDGGQQAEGMLSAHSSWKWTLQQARINAWKYHQKATSHIESWYGFHSAFLAAKYFPNKSLDEKLRKRFDYLFALLHDTVKMEPKYHKSRIQNTSGTIGLLVDKYEAFGDTSDLCKASRLADWLIKTWQRSDGAYVNHNTVYTSVIYVAKSILELTIAEKRLAKISSEWDKLASYHYASAKKAIDQLVRSDGKFETEGEMTFEDGMISCSALQIGLLALMQKDTDNRSHYLNSMLKILDSHSCLTQLRVPDARRRGGTMRYWEAQYDVQMLPNMFNSPHGWSAWRAYATYYAYLLTGEEKWLLQTYNAMGAFSHLIDYKTGQLRWAFVVDPYLNVRQSCSADTHVTVDSLSFGNPHPDLYDTRNFVIGEEYVNMISDWQTINTQDNDVHEVFKFMSEAFLNNAFLLEREDGTIIAYNCNVCRKGKNLIVTPLENQISNIHCNLKHSWNVIFKKEEKRLEPNYRNWAFGIDNYNL